MTTSTPTRTATYRAFATVMEQLQEARHGEDFGMLERAWRAVAAAHATMDGAGIAPAVLEAIDDGPA